MTAEQQAIYNRSNLVLLAKNLDHCTSESSKARHTRAGDFEKLLQLGTHIAEAQEAITKAAGHWAAAAADAGASWKQIGDAFGISKQLAHHRWAGLMTDRPLPL